MRMGESALDRRDRVIGCILGGAVGDALGAPVEFMSLREIRDRYGNNGIQELDIAYGRVGAITDDTQMTLFTAEGLIRAQSRYRDRGICNPASVVYRAYLRWLKTQGYTDPALPYFDTAPGWLVGVHELHSRRAPGNTCISALASGQMGTREGPINTSKGCGTVMRVAPVGLIDARDPFALGCETAALTHGHITGQLAAGALALIVHLLLESHSLDDAIAATLDRLSTETGNEETTTAIRRAVALAESDVAPIAETVEHLGGGWIAEEAIAIALFCALVAKDDFAYGVGLAVNHTGDSDSTGAIAGNLLGAKLGTDAIPSRWLDQLDLREVIQTVAEDLATWYRDDEVWRDRYPPV